MTAVLQLDRSSIKKPRQLKNNVFLIYSPKPVVVEPADSIKIDTNIILNLPKKTKAYVASKFRGQEIYELYEQENRLWIEILNTLYFEKLKIKNKTPLGFLVIEPEDLKFKYETKKSQRSKRVYLKMGEDVEIVLDKKEAAKGAAS